MVQAQSRDESDLCRPFLVSLPVSGASVTVISPSGGRLTLCASDVVAARIDELHFELGEGPQWATAHSAQPVMIDDVGSSSHDQWPVLGAALAELSVGAVFCIPILMGAATVGVTTLYSTTPRELDDHQQSTALAISSALAGTVVQRALSSISDDAAAESVTTPALRREVHQATGMILVQLDTSATVAYSRLQAYAFAHGRTVQSVAHDVVTGVLSFHDASE